MSITMHDGDIVLHHGDCIEIMRGMADCSVDAVVCDPPYGLEFMGKEWDGWDSSQAFQAWCQQWATEALRVLKPGGHLLAFGGTRTSHRLTCGIEDAGFEIRDSITWLYGSGFPKSRNIGKDIDKAAPRVGMFDAFAADFKQHRIAAGLTRRDIANHFPSKTGGLTGCVRNWEYAANVPTLEQWKILAPMLDLSAEWLPLIERVETDREVIGRGKAAFSAETAWSKSLASDYDITAPATAEAQQWHGWGTALKPASEPIIVARKPFKGTVAANVLQWGTGGINVDACRVGTDEDRSRPPRTPNAIYDRGKGASITASETHAAGRWPPNVLLTHIPTVSYCECGQDGAPDVDHPATDDCLYDVAQWGCEQVGTRRVKSHSPAVPSPQFGVRADGVTDFGAGIGRNGEMSQAYADADGLETVPAYRCATGCPVAELGEESRFFPTFRYQAKAGTAERPFELDGEGRKIAHPTVKPLELMRWLVKLVTPADGLILDPFAGSGTTGEAALLEGMRAILIEQDAEYIGLIEQRLSKPLQAGMF